MGALRVAAVTAVVALLGLLVWDVAHGQGSHVARDVDKGHIVPAPAFSSSLAYYDGIRRARGPANLLQGLRDYFGAHTYRRLDKPGSFHTRWGLDSEEIAI